MGSRFKMFRSVCSMFILVLCLDSFMSLSGGKTLLVETVDNDGEDYGTGLGRSLNKCPQVCDGEPWGTSSPTYGPPHEIWAYYRVNYRYNVNNTCISGHGTIKENENTFSTKVKCEITCVLNCSK